MKMEKEQLDRMLRAADIVEIEMIQGKYLAMLDQLDFLGIYDLMAKDHPEISYEMVEDGAYIGPENVAKYMKSVHDNNRNNPKKMRGWVGLQYLYTPRIVLNEAGTRARAQFNQMSPHAMRVSPYPGNGQHCTAYWFIGKYDNEYIKIDDEWKLLKTHIIAFSRTPYDEGWIKDPDARRIYHPNAEPPKRFRASTPTTLTPCTRRTAVGIGDRTCQRTDCLTTRWNSGGNNVCSNAARPSTIGLFDDNRS